jgi:hypothetical protein
MKDPAEQTSHSSSCLDRSQDGRRLLAAWWGELSKDFADHGSSANARAAASTAAHFGHQALVERLAVKSLKEVA